jgi:hypothetical protein
MTFLRTIVLFAWLPALAACATRTLKPEQAPEYVITRDFTPLYQQRPARGAVTDVSLKEKTRVKVLRKESAFSLVLLEDSRTGYVANKSMTAAPPDPHAKPFGSSAEKPKAPRKKRAAAQSAPKVSPTPTPAMNSGTSAEPTSTEPSPPSPNPAPSPAANLQVTPSETPAPAPKPSPTAVPDKPKFRL